MSWQAYVSRGFFPLLRRSRRLGFRRPRSRVDQGASDLVFVSIFFFLFLFFWFPSVRVIARRL